MRRPSVSEAPRGPARPWPARLRLVAASPDELRFLGWWPARAPLLLTPVLVALGCLSWLAPAPLAAARLLVSLIVLASALALFFASRPRRVQVRLRPRERRLLTARGAEALSERPRWLLVTEQPLTSPQPEYAAVLVDGDRRWRLLGSDDPGLLLRELRRVLAHWPVEVAHEWGLPSGSQPWAFQPRTLTGSERWATPEPRIVRGARAGRGLRCAMSVMAALVLLDLGFLLVSASARVPSVHPLSLVLPALTASCFLAVTLAVLTRHARLRIGSDWVKESCLFGVCRVQQSIPRESVRGVYLVTAGRSGQQHLLVDGSEGPLSLLVSAANAERLRDTLARELARPAQPASAAAPELELRARS
jgi:hypothetical protein